MSLFTRTGMVLVLVLAAALLPATAGASSSDPAVHAAKRCGLSSGEQRGGLGATYTSNLRAKGTSCGTAKSVARGFNSCRRSHKAGKCRPSGYRCRESRKANSSAQRSARVRCKNGGRVVRFAYVQNK
jgi:hypothetical protein